MHSKQSAGFTLIEILVVVAVIAIVSALAIPKLMGARMTTNESNAAATLRALATAQAHTVTAPSIDTDADGAAEYGYLAELAGSVPARVSAGGAPAAGAPGDELAPSMLVSSLGTVNLGVVTHSGYVFQLWLPGATAGGAVPGVAEDALGGKIGGPFPEPDNCEMLWCAYAWPLSARITGNLCFAINQDGTVLQAPNRAAVPYSGIGGGPAYDAAFSVANDMGSPLSVRLPAVDGQVWVPVE